MKNLSFSQKRIVLRDAKKEQLTYEEQVDALNKMKALLDAGILTQEEFDAKKKEILGLSSVSLITPAQFLNVDITSTL